MTAVLDPTTTLPPVPPQENHDEGGSEGIERITFLCVPAATDARLKTAALTGDSQTAVVNRALQIYAYLTQVWNEGGQVFIQEGGDTAVELTFH